MTIPMLLTCSAFAQSQFEVASIRPSLSPADRGGTVDIGVHIDGSHVRFIQLSLRDYLARAYRIKVTRVSGPDWTASQTFDISATLPAGSSPAQIPEMLQALLAERFQVKIHKGEKDFPVYVLLPGKGPLKMKESPPDPNASESGSKDSTDVAATGSEAGASVNLGHGSSYSFVNNRFEATKLTMDQFTSNLERFAGRPIVDKTNLTGRYDFALDFTPEDYRAMLMRVALSAGAHLPPEAMRLVENNSGGPALSDALQRVGLRIEARKMPLDVLVIDDALKTPTAN